MIDLAAYLERIRLPARPTLDHHGLNAVQRAHRLAIPFENLDIALGRGIAIDGASVFAKLVTARRGGYCFEQNRLLHDALTALGFHTRPLLARVWLSAGDDVPPLTHTFELVTIDGQEWIADAGFGGSYTPPLPLAEGEVTAPDGATFRLTRDTDHGWMLTREGPHGATDGRGSAGVQPQYSFTTAAVYPSDLALTNHWTSTAPGTRFTTHRIVSIALPRGFAGLTDRAYRRRAGDEESAGEIADPRVYRLRLSMMFGIDLTAEEVATLGLF